MNGNLQDTSQKKISLLANNFNKIVHAWHLLKQKVRQKEWGMLRSSNFLTG
jgi:hypothetical protein